MSTSSTEMIVDSKSDRCDLAQNIQRYSGWQSAQARQATPARATIKLDNLPLNSHKDVAGVPR